MPAQLKEVLHTAEAVVEGGRKRSWPNECPRDAARGRPPHPRRTNADSLQQDANEARLYDREISSDESSSNQTDLRIPHAERRVTVYQAIKKSNG
jgi:hypothetical protein